MASAVVTTALGHMIMKHYISVFSVFGEYIGVIDTADPVQIQRLVIVSRMHETICFVWA